MGYPTKNDLPESVRTKAVALLDARLADVLAAKLPSGESPEAAS